MKKERGTKSCGCWRKESTATRKPSRTHGLSRTPLHDIWCGIIQRCEDAASKNYRNYGARGIKVCDRWRNSFEAFLEDMGERPARHSIDRIDNEGPYSPENCRWATRREQMSNTRVNRLIDWRGETKCITEWCRVLNLDANIIRRRDQMGWDAERMFTTPTNKPFREWKGFKGE